jgi:hypothetical protein
MFNLAIDNKLRGCDVSGHYVAPSGDIHFVPQPDSFCTHSKQHHGSIIS